MAQSASLCGVQSLHKDVQVRLPSIPAHRLPQQNLAHRSISQITQRQTRGQQLSSLVVQAAAVGDVDDLEDSEVEEAVAAVQSGTPEEANLKFTLNLLWMENNIGIAVDQVYAPKMRSPLTEYFFWPKVDAWEELKTDLESKQWVSSRDRIVLLNLTTEVINFWQTEGKRPTIEEARAQFQNCVFRG